MLKDKFKKYLISEVEEGIGQFDLGHYPTSDESETEWIDPERNPHKCQIPTTDGKNVHIYIVQLTPKIIYGGVSCDGVKWEVLELPKTKSNYFSKFKNTIENTYGVKFLDETQAKDLFSSYVESSIA